MNRAAINIDVVKYWMAVFFLLFLSTFALEGVLRFWLFRLGLVELIYIRDVIPALTCSVVFSGWTGTSDDYVRRFRRFVGFFVCFVLYTASVALIRGVELLQIALAVKILMLFLYGASLFYIFAERRIEIFLGVLSLWGAVCFGVFLNSAVGSMEWEGIEYSTSFGVKSTSLEWWTEDAKRLSGFSGSSYRAASMIGCLGIWVCTFIPAALRLLVCGVSLWAIFLTTTKGVVIPFVLAGLVVIAPAFSYLGRLYIVLSGALCIGVPLLGEYIGLRPFFSAVARDAPSLVERIDYMWPLAFSSVDGFGAVVGAGLGSIGVARSVGSVVLEESFGDNMFVYLFVVVGAVSIGLWLRFVGSILAALRAYPGLMCGLGGIMAVGYGLTANVFEEPLLAIICGAGYIAGGETRSSA